MKIGKYEIRRQIGRGAMGVVYEAFDPVIERRVAVKTLRLELFESSQIADVRTRFKREAQSAGQLAHPHIVTVYDYGEHEGTPYIVMEFLAGNELSRILGRGARLPLSEVVRLMTQLLGALTYAHERKVVHRDVKPGNIFILDDGSLKVVDFGLAHVEASNLTDTGALLCTPAYMSPEQFLALPIDERSDIFSAGVILYELLTGDKPFTGSVTSIMQKVLRQEPIEPSVLNPTISTTWDTVIKRAMAKKPDARFQSARQFSETIKQAFAKGALNVSVEVTFAGDKTADQWGETLRPSPDKQQVSKAQRPVPPVSAGPEIEPARSSSRKGLAIATVAVAVAVGAATFYLSQRPRDDLAKPDPAAMKAQKDDGAAAKAAAERAAVDKAAADAKAAADKAAQEAKVAQESLAQEKAAQANKAAEKALAEKIAAEKAAKEKTAAEVTRLERLRAEKADAERIAKETERKRKEDEKTGLAELEKKRQEVEQTRIAEENKTQEAARLVELQRQRQEEEAKKRAAEEKRTKYDVLIAEAKQAMNNKDKKLAINKYNEALILFPGDAVANSGVKEAEKQFPWKGRNLALMREGGKLSIPVGEDPASSKDAAIDGITNDYGMQHGWAASSWNMPGSYLFITLKEVSLINKIRFLLWDKDNRYYRYRLEVSRDQQHWEVLSDKSSGEWRSWQEFVFDSKEIRYIKIAGLYNSATIFFIQNPWFHVVEIEAFGIPLSEMK